MDGHFSPTWLQTPPNHNLSPPVQRPHREVSHTSQIIPPSTPLDRELDTGTFLGTLSSYKEDLGCRVNFFHAMTLQTPTNTSSSCVKKSIHLWPFLHPSMDPHPHHYPTICRRQNMFLFATIPTTLLFRDLRRTFKVIQLGHKTF